MHAPCPRHITRALVALAAVACAGDDRRQPADDQGGGLAPDSFVAPARGVSSAGAPRGDSALRRMSPERRDTTTPGAEVVIGGSSSGFALSGDAVQPSGGVMSGQVASGQEPRTPARDGTVNGGSAPPAPPVQQPETPTIIANEPSAPTPAPAPAPASPSTPPATPPAGTPPRVVAKPAPHAPAHPPASPGASDTAGARPCGGGTGGAGVSDTATRSPCGQPGASDTAGTRHRGPVLIPGARDRPVVPLTPKIVKP